MYKYIIAFIILSFLTITHSNAQVLEPVTWETSVKKISDTEFDLISTATIDEGWHLYSQNVPEDGPIPTTFNYTTTDEFSLVEITTEEEGHVVDDPVFLMKIKFFEDKFQF